MKKESDFRLLDGIPIGLYRSSVTGHFFDANDKLVKIFAYTDRESLIEINAADRKQWQA